MAYLFIPILWQGIYNASFFQVNDRLAMLPEISLSDNNFVLIKAIAWCKYKI